MKGLVSHLWDDGRNPVSSEALLRTFRIRSGLSVES